MGWDYCENSGFFFFWRKKEPVGYYRYDRDHLNQDVPVNSLSKEEIHNRN
jgi:hypothetical protein